MEGVEIKNASQSKILLAEIDGLLMAADLNGEAMVPAFVVETKLQLEVRLPSVSMNPLLSQYLA